MSVGSSGQLRDEEISASLGPDDLRSLSLSYLGRALRIFSMFDDMDNPVIRRDPPPLLRIANHEEEAAALRVLIEDVIIERPMAAEKLDSAGALIQQVLDSRHINLALTTFEKVREFVSGLLLSQKAGAAHPSAFNTTQRMGSLVVIARKPATKKLKGELDREIEEQNFVAAVMQMCADHRLSKLDSFTREEQIALERAYSMLDHGVRIPRYFRSIDHARDRDIQTYISFADPGDGHLTVTVRDEELLTGLIVHIEYIDRDGVDDKDRVEAYRLPAIRNAARVRLHVGASTPCTAFIGRPVFEAGEYDLGLLKAGHTMASVCSAMFAHGVADCKVAMDGMSARQAVDFMRVVAGNVVRDPIRQRLSAAFNLNTPLKDDITSRAAARFITDRFEIAKMAIRLASVGRFNKIAWDGASNERPGKPILIGQLTRVQLLELVHAAHAKDLETYISAGMKPEHLRDAVFVGVGGVGIGTSLHHLALDNTIGEIDPKKVKDALNIQKDASSSLAGRSASELAQLDWEYAQRRLLPSLRTVRHQLFEKLSTYLGFLDKTVTLGPANPTGATPKDFDETTVESKLLEELEGLLKESDSIRKEAMARTPLSTGITTTRSREFSLDDGPQPGPRAFEPDSEASPDLSNLGILGNQAWGVVQAYKADEKNSEFTASSIKQIEELIQNRDREGLMRLFQL